MLDAVAAKNEGVTFPMWWRMSSSPSLSSATIPIERRKKKRKKVLCIVVVVAETRRSRCECWHFNLLWRFQWLVFFFSVRDCEAISISFPCTHSLGYMLHGKLRSYSSQNKYCSRRKRIIMIIYDEISRETIFIYSINERTNVTWWTSRCRRDSACRAVALNFIISTHSA